MSFKLKHSIHFKRVQDVSIRGSSSAVIQNLGSVTLKNNTNQHGKQDTSQTLHIPYVSEWVEKKCQPLHGSENSNIIQKYPQNLPSEGEAAKTRLEEEGSSLRGALQGLPIEEIGRVLDKQICENKTVVKKNAWPQELYCSGFNYRLSM